MILRRTDWAEEGDNVWLRRELGKGEHGAGIGRLVVLCDELELFSQHTTGFIDAIERDFGTGQRISADGGCRTGDRKHHANL